MVNTHSGFGGQEFDVARVRLNTFGQLLQCIAEVRTAYARQIDFSDFDLADSVPPQRNLAVWNLKGPPVPLYFGGARVEAAYPMGPVGEGMGLSITLLSNMGRVDVGVLACREHVPEPWEIADGFAAGVEELERLADARSARG